MRKISKKLNLNQKKLLLGMLIGDGTITNHPDYKIDHSEAQLEYLKWKIKLLDEAGIKNSGLKIYKSTIGYNKGKNVYRVRIKTNITIKALRRSIYTPKKTITRNMLNWFTAREIAIWFMDDGSVNVNTSKQRSSIKHTVLIATCVDEKVANIIVDYFKEVWNIQFRIFPEQGQKTLTYSIATTSEEECRKFNNLVYPYVKEVPCLLYKLRNNFTKEEFKKLQESNPDVQDLLNL